MGAVNISAQRQYKALYKGESREYSLDPFTHTFSKGINKNKPTVFAHRRKSVKHKTISDLEMIRTAGQVILSHRITTVLFVRLCILSLIFLDFLAFSQHFLK